MNNTATKKKKNGIFSHTAIVLTTYLAGEQKRFSLCFNIFFLYSFSVPVVPETINFTFFFDEF